jgi:RNA polymerase sigma factor (sigma-70 family)
VNSLTDQQLLRDYAEKQSEAAFAELVRRHVDLVYSAALRMVCDAHLAQDVTQGVFVALAQNARPLAEHPVLSGWLHRTACNLAANTVRSETRRRTREQEAAVMNQLNDTETDWETISVHLDDGLGQLDEAERDALMLRYFERKSAREMAGILGLSEEAAQKRASRAVERLREIFSKERVTIGAGGLAVLISANAVQAAPVGLAATISTASALAGTAVQTSTLVTATKTIAMTTFQKSIIVAALAVAAGTGLYAEHQNVRQRDAIQSLQQQLTPLTAQLQQLQQERDDATNRLAGLMAENAELESSSNEAELLRLRGEISQLKMTEAQPADGPTDSAAKALAAKVTTLKQWLDQNPGRNIPELQLLTDQEWLRCAASFNALDSDGEMRAAFAYLRQSAKNDFAWDIGRALDKYITANNGQLPNAMQDLTPYFDPSVSVDNTMLARYEVLQKGNLNQFSPSEPLIAESPQPADTKYDMIFQIGAFGFTYRDVSGAMGGGGSEKFSPDMTAGVKPFAKQ